MIHKQAREQRGWPDTDDVISSTVSLIARLEHDRQETIESLLKERVRVQQLGEALDKESERRLEVLEVAVQKGNVRLASSPGSNELFIVE